MSKLLASVCSTEEAMMALAAEVDIIDLKNPSAGALGALPIPVIESIVRLVKGQKPVSATIGDIPMEPNLITSAIASVASSGVDIVKVGFFGGDQQRGCIQALSTWAARHKLVAVLFADKELDLSLLQSLHSAGFYGVMLDTAEKNGIGLPDMLEPSELKDFVQKAEALGLLTGLAGALKLSHIENMAKLGATYLGFRSALCEQNDRCSELVKDRIEQVRNMLHKSNMALEGALLV